MTVDWPLLQSDSSSNLLTFPECWNFKVISEKFLKEVQKKAAGGYLCNPYPVCAHILSFRMLYKWGLQRIVSSLIQSDLIYAVVYYVTQTPYPDPIAFNILMSIT